MEECIEAGMERQEHRGCHARKACPKDDRDKEKADESIRYIPAHDWVPLAAKKGGKFESASPVITGNDIVNHHKHYPKRKEDTGDEAKAETLPNRVSNYWVPSEKTVDAEKGKRKRWPPILGLGGEMVDSDDGDPFLFLAREGD